MTAGRGFRIPPMHYLNGVLTPRGLRAAVRRTTKLIRETAIPFEAIAFTGVSGALVGAPVALRLGKYPIVVRKPSDGSHSQYEVEGVTGEFRYAIVDDFIASGSTIRRIIDQVKMHREQAECVAVFLWNWEERGRPFRDGGPPMWGICDWTF